MRPALAFGRAAGVLGVILFASVVSACLQPSLNPLVHPNDSVFEPKLLGAWRCGEDEVWTFERDEEPDLTQPVYKVTVAGDGETATLIAFIARLDDDDFINFAIEDAPEPKSRFVRRHMLGVWTFGRMTLKDDTLQLAMLSDSPMDKLEEAGLLSIGMRRLQGDVLLTAGPAELQRFAKAFGGDDDIFGDEVRFVREGRPAPADAGGSYYSEK